MLRKPPASNAWAGIFKNDNFSYKVCPDLPKKGYFQSKTEKMNITIKTCIIKSI